MNQSETDFSIYTNTILNIHNTFYQLGNGLFSSFIYNQSKKKYIRYPYLLIEGTYNI